jgi:hypothetical protein
MSSPEEPTPPPTGVDALRAVAEAVFRVRAGLEHADIEAARHAARHLVIALDGLPTDRAAYEALCEEADRQLAADPDAWVPGAGGQPEQKRADQNKPA